jgi:hypothetical protein
MQAKEAPNPKHQIANKFQTPSINDRNTVFLLQNLEVENWCLFGIWDLDFGA